MTAMVWSLMLWPIFWVVGYLVGFAIGVATERDRYH